MMTKVVEWIEQTTWTQSGDRDENQTVKDATGDSRGKRSIDSKGSYVKEYGIFDWIAAFRKDPTEYQCIRKLACETLANSTLAERSIKSSLGDTLM